MDDVRADCADSSACSPCGKSYKPEGICFAAETGTGGPDRDHGNQDVGFDLVCLTCKKPRIDAPGALY